MQESTDDIIDVIKRLRANDADAELIGRRGRDFVLQHLHRRARWCYWREVLVRAGDHGAGGWMERRGEEGDGGSGELTQFAVVAPVGRLMSLKGGIAVSGSGGEVASRGGGWG